MQVYVGSCMYVYVYVYINNCIKYVCKLLFLYATLTDNRLECYQYEHVRTCRGQHLAQGTIVPTV